MLMESTWIRPHQVFPIGVARLAIALVFGVQGLRVEIAPNVMPARMRSWPVMVSARFVQFLVVKIVPLKLLVELVMRTTSTLRIRTILDNASYVFQVMGALNVTL